MKNQTIIIMAETEFRIRFELRRDIEERLREPGEIAKAIIDSGIGIVDNDYLTVDWKYKLTPNRKSGWSETEHGTLIWDFGKAEQFVALINNKVKIENNKYADFVGSMPNLWRA